MERVYDLKERLLNFSAEVIVTLRQLENTIEYRVIKGQLIRSSGSMGANYEESQAGSSRPDFTNKVKIALKESRETHYWLRLLIKVNTDQAIDPKLRRLADECEELKRILGSIAKK